MLWTFFFPLEAGEIPVTSKALKGSGLFCAVLSLVLQIADYHSFISICISLDLLLTDHWLHARHYARCWGSHVIKFLSIHSWLLQVPPNDLSTFTPAVFQTIPAVQPVILLNHKYDLATPAVPPCGTAPLAFRGKLSSWNGLQRDNAWLTPSTSASLLPLQAPHPRLLCSCPLASFRFAFLPPFLWRTWSVCLLCWRAPPSPFSPDNHCG